MFSENNSIKVAGKYLNLLRLMSFLTLITYPIKGIILHQLTFVFYNVFV